jgi:endonuclease YncB( thermonuclease family)
LYNMPAKKLLLFFAIFMSISFDAYSQEMPSPVTASAKERIITVDVRVADEVTLVSDRAKLSLWGVKKAEVGSPVFELKARTALENKIMGQKVTCTIKAVVDSEYKAQCVNANEDDLSLFLLQQGFVTLNRNEIFSTIYESPYVEAESLAQSALSGVWASVDSMATSDSSGRTSRDFMFSAILIASVFLVAIGVISFYIMRGFGRVVTLQNQSMDLAAKERDLREREKNVIASMIHSEIRENKPKIDAYLTVYEEMLAEAMSSDEPSFMKTGEIVQRQPSLSRNVFDGNTGTLNVLGARMASEIIHYYARIKTNPDYFEIKPDMPVEKVRDTIRASIDHAKKLDMLSAKLLESFCNSHMIEDL